MKHMNYYLKFDTNLQYGSPEHFFHFMLGYFLPGLNRILVYNFIARKNIRFTFDSCGPVMNNIISAWMKQIHVEYEILSPVESSKREYTAILLVSRWDMQLLNLLKLNEEFKLSDQSFNSMLSRVLRLQKLLHRIKCLRIKIILKLKILFIKYMVLKSNMIRFNPFDIRSYTDQYILLKRSEEPDYYKKGGGAQFESYGTNRRALVGIDQAVADLRKKGIPIVTFEPGNYPLIHQIKVFSCAKGVIGIKGAEFANMIWMKPKSKLIVIIPDSMKSKNVQKVLSGLLNLEYIEVKTTGGLYPDLNELRLEKYLF